MNNNIPKHWQVKTLGEVCDRITKGGTPTTYGFSFVTKGINFIKVENIEGGNVNQSSIRNFISEEAHNYQKKSILEENDLLFSIAGTIGRTCLIKRDYLPANTNQALAILRGYHKHIRPQFLTYQLDSSISQYVKSKARGGAMNNISLEDLKGIELVLPPLPEQQAIVSKIEELLSDLENGKQQLQTAQQQLKIYRQSLLKWAFEGKLTNKNVKDGELPKGWKVVELKDVSAKITDGEHFRPITQEAGIPFLSAKDVRDLGVSFDDPLYISGETAKKAMQRCNPERGDLLIVSRGATVGRMCIVNTDRQFCLLGSVILIKVNQTINSKFLNFVLKSPIANQKMITVSGATAQQAIYLRDIKNITIPLPTIEEQKLIVDELESKLTVCDKIEETISQSLLQAESLRQSILKKAFEGKLV